MAEKKRYVVRNWRETGVFESRDIAKTLVSWFSWAKYKGFSSLQEAQYALEKWADEYYQPAKKRHERDIEFVKKSIAVDAACSWSTKVMEYKGVDLLTEKEVFHFSFHEGTNNIGEFLALVHGVSWLKQEWKTDYSLYSDSMNAIHWVEQKRCKTSYVPHDEALMDLIIRAEHWLQNNTYTTPILKWDTKNRGEIPADFWRK